MIRARPGGPPRPPIQRPRDEFMSAQQSLIDQPTPDTSDPLTRVRTLLLKPYVDALEARLGAVENEQHDETELLRRLESQLIALEERLRGDLANASDGLHGQLAQQDTRLEAAETARDRLETRLQHGLESVQETVTQRLDAQLQSMEARLRNHVTETVQTSTGELERQLQRFQDLDQGLRSANEQLEELAQQLGNETTQIRAQQKAHTQTLIGHLRAQYQTLSANVQEETERLHQEKMSRHDLAEVFTDMARRVNDGFNRQDGIDPEGNPPADWTMTPRTPYETLSRNPEDGEDDPA